MAFLPRGLCSDGCLTKLVTGAWRSTAGRSARVLGANRFTPGSGACLVGYVPI